MEIDRFHRGGGGNQICRAMDSCGLALEDCVAAMEDGIAAMEDCAVAMEDYVVAMRCSNRRLRCSVVGLLGGVTFEHVELLSVV